jgi:NADH-quinone oxidoreductase subunit K
MIIFLFNFINFNFYNFIFEEKLLNDIEKLKFIHELIPLTFCIFLVGFIGFIESKDFLNILINIEIMMLGINFYLITLSIYYGSYIGQVYALCFLAITAAETAIGLGLLILLYRNKGQIKFTEISTLKG